MPYAKNIGADQPAHQRLCCSLPRWYNVSGFYIRNFKLLSSFCSSVGWYFSYLVGNSEDRFSRDVAHINFSGLFWAVSNIHVMVPDLPDGVSSVAFIITAHE